MKYKKERKRIIIYDKDIVGFTEVDWRGLMKRVQGRHYKDLQKSGGAWTFSVDHAGLLEEWLVPNGPSEEQGSCAIQTDDGEEDASSIVTTECVAVQTDDGEEDASSIVTTECVAVQTDDGEKDASSIVTTECVAVQTDVSSSIVEEAHVDVEKEERATQAFYKHDAPPEVYEFCRRWLTQ